MTDSENTYDNPSTPKHPAMERFAKAMCGMESPPQEKRSNAELDPLVDDYQTIVANMESIVHDLPTEIQVNMTGAQPDRTKLMRLLHSRDGICSEAGEYADQYKRHVYYKQPLNETNLIEELGDLLWYIALACNVLGITMRQVMVANAQKLRKRYPQKFTVENAVNRDTVAEIQELTKGLESGMDRIDAQTEYVDDKKPSRIGGFGGVQGEIIYLACPRYHQTASVMNARFAAANRATAILMKSGKLIFSPISHGHYIAFANGWSFSEWEKFDKAMLSRCSELYVLRIGGWQESRGVTEEIKFAMERSIPITYLSPSTFNLTLDYPYLIPAADTDETAALANRL